MKVSIYLGLLCCRGWLFRIFCKHFLDAFAEAMLVGVKLYWVVLHQYVKELPVLILWFLLCLIATLPMNDNASAMYVLVRSQCYVIVIFSNAEGQGNTAVGSHFEWLNSVESIFLKKPITMWNCRFIFGYCGCRIYIAMNLTFWGTFGAPILFQI